MLQRTVQESSAVLYLKETCFVKKNPFEYFFGWLYFCMEVHCLLSFYCATIKKVMHEQVKRSLFTLWHFDSIQRSKIVISLSKQRYIAPPHGMFTMNADQTLKSTDYNQYLKYIKLRYPMSKSDSFLPVIISQLKWVTTRLAS